MIFLLFGAVGFLAAGFSGAAIGVILAVVLRLIVNWHYRY